MFYSAIVNSEEANPSVKRRYSGATIKNPDFSNILPSAINEDASRLIFNSAVLPYNWRTNCKLHPQLVRRDVIIYSFN